METLQWIVFVIFMMLNPIRSIATEVIEIRHSMDFLEKVRKPETIYDIRCEVNLENKIVYLPSKSVLRFTGGIIKKGTLIGNNTLLDNPTNLPIFEEVEIGTAPYQFVNDAIYVDWFAGDSDADRTQAAIDFAKKNRNAINFLSREYVFNHTVIIPMGQMVLKGTGGGGEYQNLGTKIITSSVFKSAYDGSPLFYVSGESTKANQSLGLVSGNPPYERKVISI